jgi:hypothetical protein
VGTRREKGNDGRGYESEYSIRGGRKKNMKDYALSLRFLIQ